MKFKLEMDCGNAAFDEEARWEVARILKDLSELLSCRPGELKEFDGTGLRDYNGNTVGRVTVVD